MWTRRRKFRINLLKSAFDQHKSALENAFKVAKTENEEECRLLEEAYTELTELKAHFDEQKSILDKDKSDLVDAVKVAKGETEELRRLLDESQVDEFESALRQSEIHP